MGKASLLDMLAHTREEIALEWHLNHNHYPPMGEFLDAAKAALAAARDGEPDRLVTLPEGVAFRDGRESVEARHIIESLHLESFLEG